MPFGNQKPPSYTAQIGATDVSKLKAEWCQFLFGKPTLTSPKQRLEFQELTKESSAGIERIHLSYKVEKNVTVRAYLLRHQRKQKRFEEKPLGVVLFHASGPNTIDVEGSIDARQHNSIGAKLAEQGYTVICPRCFIYRSDFDGEKPRDHHTTQVKEMQRKHPKWKGMARMIWDGMRAVDVLIKEYHVAADRIGAVGHSLGAKQVLFTMAFDKRIAAGVFSDGGIGISFSNWEDEWYLGPKIYQSSKRDNHEILALIAPRAFLLVGGKVDHDGAWPFIEGAKELWESQGNAEAIRWFRHNEGHCFPAEARKNAYGFFERYLARAGPEKSVRA
jgi:dienelactone hydrolase